MGNFISDIGEGLFGSDDEPAGTLNDPTPNEFKELRPDIRDTLRDIFRNIDPGAKFDPDSADLDRLVSGITPEEQSLLERIRGLTGGPTDLQRQGRDVLGQTISGDFLDPQSNPFLQSTIDSATRRINESNAVQNAALIGQFKRAGQTLRTDANKVGSSAFLNQARLGEQDRLNAIGDVTGNILSQNFQNERNRQQQAIRDSETISTQDINNAIQGLQAQALPRLIEDLGIQRGIQEFNDRIQRLLQALQIGGNLQQGSQVIGTNPGQVGSLAQVATGGITGGAIGGIQGILRGAA